MIKVLTVVIDNHIGGIQNRILHLGKDLKNQGIQSIVLSPNGEGDFAKTARNCGFTVHYASIESPKLFTTTRNILKNFLWILKFPVGVIETIRVIKCEDIDIVHANGLLALHAILAARITKTPIMWHLIGTIYPSLLVKGLRPLFYWSENIILVTNKTKKYYLGNRFIDSKVKVVFEPVDISCFQITQEIKVKKEFLRSKYHIPLNSIVVGFVGNISPVKGLEYFLNVARVYKNQANINVCFLIAGYVSVNHIKYLNKLKSIINEFNLMEDVIILQHFKDVREIYSIIDIFLMTSIAEGTPLVILEAMAMEIPIIAPDVGGISEQICNGVTGFVVPPKDAEATLKYLQELLINPDLRVEMGKMGRMRVISLFSLKRCVQLHQDLYMKAVNHER